MKTRVSSVTFAGEVHPRKMREVSSNLAQSSYIECVLNAAFPNRNIRISHPCSAPTFEVIKVVRSYEHINNRLCPRVDWQVGGRNYFAFIKPSLEWKRSGNLVTGVYDHQIENNEQTLQEVINLIRETENAACES